MGIRHQAEPETHTAAEGEVEFMPSSITLANTPIALRLSNHRSLWRRLESAVLSGAIFPIIRKREYPSSFAIKQEFDRYEFAPETELRAFQLTRLRLLLQHAAEKIPYYRDIFRSVDFYPAKARLPEDFLRLPILTKSALRRSIKELLANDVEIGSLISNASGGSTGTPVEFYQDQLYWETSQASRTLFMSWWGVKPGEPMASVWGADRDIPEWTWKQRFYYKLCQVRVCNAFALSEARMEEFARQLNEWQPRFINGYATALETFARFLLQRKKFKIRPVAIESSAETLTDQQREIIEAAFDAPLYNFYGSREVNNLAAQCKERRGLHTNMLSRYIEVVDDDGRPLPPGVPGRILVTDLSNKAMPLIRYENQDIGSWSDAKCSCGRSFQMLEKIWGRSSDFITTPAGKLIHGEYFTHLFYHVPEVDTFQVLQQVPGEIRISIVLQPGGAGFSTDSLKHKISAAVGPEMRLQLQIVDTIARPPSGKHRFTISTVPVNWGRSATHDG